MPTDFKGFKQGGNTIPVNDTTARNGVIANTKLIKDTVGFSGKNKWDKSKTVGIDATITQTSDGFRAQVSSHTWGSARCDFPTPEKNKDFILSCKANVATAGNFMKMQVYGSTDGSDYSNSIAVTDTYSETKELELAFNSGNYNYLRITLYLTNGTATSADVTFEKPMLCDADILDSTYEPYFGSTAFPRSEQAVLGAKNLLIGDKAISKTENGLTFTKNNDGTITINGTATVTTFYTIQNSVYADDSYILNGCPFGGATNSYAIRWNTGGTNLYDTGNGVLIPKGTATALSIEIRIENGATLNNLVFKPMLRLASDSDDTYVPYAMTNKELTEKVIPLESEKIYDTTIGIFIFKSGNIVTVSFDTMTAVTKDVDEVFFTLPEGYRPYTNMQFIEPLNNRRVVIATDGKISCKVALSNTYIRGYATFVVM